MHDFGRLVYLDLQKSGSTFVSRFLNETCRLPAVKEVKHGRIAEDYNPDAFYFITIRHPIAQYSSLFRYGLDGRGALYYRLSHLGRSDLYKKNSDSFNQWLRFLLDHRNAAMLGEGFEKVPESFDLGFLSFRYLMLSFAYPLETLLRKEDRTDVSELLKQRSIVRHVIRNENLNQGLRELALELQPQYFDARRVEKFFKRPKSVNASKVGDEMINVIDADIRQLIVRKERVLLSYYSDAR